MYLLGYVFLARAALAQYQDAHVGGGDQFYLVVYLTESRTLTLVNRCFVPLHPFL